MPRIQKLLADFDYRGARLEAAAMEDRCRRLALAKPIPSFVDQLREGGMNRLLAAYWSSAEAEGLKYFATHGARLGAIAVSSAWIGDRTVTRAEVREELARRGYSQAQLRRFSDNEAIAIENEAIRKQLAEHGGPLTVRN